jgi:hypothetical protein
MSNFDRNWRPARAKPASSDLTDRADELRASLRLLDPELVAAKSGIAHLPIGPARGELHFPLWGKSTLVTWPNLTGYAKPDDELPAFTQTLLMYYLLTADGMPLSGKWVSFADLPGGRMYAQAYQGYSGDEIVKAFDPELDKFKRACLSAGGTQHESGDAAFSFIALPRLPLLVNYWLGDEDFPSSCKILFDSSATHYLPIDGCAIIGSMLTKKLISS